jgi:cytochrome c-type biogenesis protein CcmH/NrfG
MYEAVLRAEPKNCSAFYQLGECYLSTGAPQAAHFCYLHALELNPDYEPAWKRVMNNKHLLG